MASLLLRQSAVAARGTTSQLSRSIATSSVLRKDLVQDLYLREIKAYKPPPAAKDAHVGAVKTFSIPALPQPPSLPSDFASELASYDAAEPGAPPASASLASTTGEPAGGAREFLAFLEQDYPKEEAHH
ncbi:ATP synthase complex subunit H-domain-containing protein [Gautieria morchelliformis]|nr:ATP synthase complex subunit H-domain-containing protein [Gautieria morchelliformis]